jgi:hypothetical protein
LKSSTIDQQLTKLDKQSMAAAKETSRKASHPTAVRPPKTDTVSETNKPITFAYQKPKAGPTATNTTGGGRSRGSGLHGRVNPRGRY